MKKKEEKEIKKGRGVSDKRNIKVWHERRKKEKKRFKKRKGWK